ncbi:RsiV family protein [Avibacterium avium]|uniref:RsiV family protein n=1 Tax=Avibacterium avium TaxID=751 RepID=UPI003BF87589
MKKTLLPLLIVAAFGLSACNEQNKTAEKPQVQASEKISQNFPALRVENSIIFDKHETLPLKLESGDTIDAQITTFVNVLETQVPWLNQLLIANQYEDGLSYFKLNYTQPANADIKPKANPSKQDLEQLFAKIHQEGIQSIKANGNWGAEFAVHLSYVGQKNNWVVFRKEIYTYSGGAHGLQVGGYLNIDVEKQAVLSLDDLIDKKDQPALSEKLWKIYTALPENQGDIYADKSDFYISPEFYFDQNGLNFVYPPYALFPYAYGETTLTLPWYSDEMKLIKVDW